MDMTWRPSWVQIHSCLDIMLLAFLLSVTNSLNQPISLQIDGFSLCLSWIRTFYCRMELQILTYDIQNEQYNNVGR